MNKDKDRFKGIIALAACAILWSSSGVLIKFVDWNPIAIAGARSAIAAIVMIAFLGRKPRFKADLGLIMGGLLYSATMLLFVSANKLTTSANAIFLQYSCPAWTALGAAIILKERPKPLDYVFIVLVIGAMGLFFLDDLDSGGAAGNLLAALSGATFGICFVFMRGQKGGTQEESLILSHIITFLVSIPFMAVSKPPEGVMPWAAIGAMGVFQIGAASMLFSYGMRRVEALDSVITATLEPIFNPVWVFLLKGEVPGPWSLAGGAAIIVLVALRPFIRSRRRETGP